MSRERIDDTIDEVAREMTAGDARANLRARVLADIESHVGLPPDTPARSLAGAPSPRSAPSQRAPARLPSIRPFAWRPAFAALAIATLVIAVIVELRPAGPGGPAPQVVERRPGPLGPGEATPPMQMASQIRPAGPKGRAPHPTPRVNPFAEPPLEEESIAVDPIAVTPMPPTESIAVEELPSIAPIAVAPLGPGEEK